MNERFAAIEAAFDRTMREFPGTDPGALIVFARSAHLLFGPLTDADFQWARDRAAAAAPTAAPTDKQAAYAARRAQLREAVAIPQTLTPKE